MRLPEAELSFYFAALAQLEPGRRPVFTARVAQLLGAHPDPGPGDVDRAVRAALVGLWTPPAIEEVLRPPRWARGTPAFERVSKGAAIGRERAGAR
jgi:hypothetical protein